MPQHFPKKIAAITSMGGLPQVDPNFDKKCENLAKNNLPIWHVHNRDDGAWHYFEAERYINTIRSFKPAIDPRFTTFEKGEGKLNHDCWTRTNDPAYKEDGKNIYEWMLQYKR